MSDAEAIEVPAVSEHGESSNIRLTYCGQARPVLSEGEGTWQLVTSEFSTEGQVRDVLVAEGYGNYKGRDPRRVFAVKKGYECRVVKVSRTVACKIVEKHP